MPLLPRHPPQQPASSLLSACAGLFTDDSFAFATAANAVQYDIERELSARAGRPIPQVGSQPYKVREAWEAAMMAALSTIAAKFKFAWAKVPCAKAIAKAYEMRYGLGGENKAQVERWQRMTVQPKR